MGVPDLTVFVDELLYETVNKIHPFLPKLLLVMEFHSIMATLLSAEIIGLSHHSGFDWILLIPYQSM